MRTIIISCLWLLFTSAFIAQESTNKEIDSLILKGRVKQALQKLHSLEDSFDKNIKIASIYYQIDKTKKAVVYYEKALKAKDDYRAKVQLGKAYQKLKDHQKAIEIFEDIVYEDPQNFLLKYQLGKLYLARRKADKAIRIFQELYDADKSNVNYPYQKGIAYAVKKDRNKMMDSFIEAYLVDSTHIKSIHLLANSFFKINEMDSAKLFIEKGLELDPYHDKILKVKGNLLYKTKNYGKAIQVYKMIDSLKPNQLSVKKKLGTCYYNTGQYEEARAYFESARKMDFKDFKITTNLAHTEVKLKNYKRAQFLYMMSTTIGKQDRSEEYLGLGLVYNHLEDPKKGIEMFHKAYQENKWNYKAVYQLAKSLDDYYNDKKEAYKYYSEYLLRFDDKDSQLTADVERRVKQIKKDYFLRGEKLQE